MHKWSCRWPYLDLFIWAGKSVEDPRRACTNWCKDQSLDVHIPDMPTAVFHSGNPTFLFFSFFLCLSQSLKLTWRAHLSRYALALCPTLLPLVKPSHLWVNIRLSFELECLAKPLFHILLCYNQPNRSEGLLPCICIQLTWVNSFLNHLLVL